MVFGDGYDETMLPSADLDVPVVDKYIHPQLDGSDATVEHLGCVQVGIGRDGRPRLWAGEVAAELEILVKPEGHAHAVDMLTPYQSLPDAGEQLDPGVMIRAVGPRGTGWTG